MSEQLLILRKFPLLIPEDSNFTKYRGFIKAGNEDFYICIHVPHYPDLQGLSLQCCWELSVVLQGKQKDLREWTSSCSTLIAYLECLHSLIMKCLEMDTVPALPVDTCRRVISELEVLGTSHVLQVSNSLSEIKLRAVDGAGRTHVLCLGLCASYPSTAPVIQADLPDVMMPQLKRGSSLSAIYKSFLQQIAALQAFWNELDELDSVCWVIDPENPTREDTYRRIMIGNNVSIQITVDPLNPLERPDMKFLGSERAVAPFQTSLAEKFQSWPGSGGLVQKLKWLWGLPLFPAAPEPGVAESQDLVHQGECAICFLVRLDGDLPSRACNSDKCGTIYHTACLSEWLQTLPTSTKSFSYIHGECPNCGLVISCPRPS